MKKSINFKGIKFMTDTADHTFYCVNQDNLMAFYVMSKGPITVGEEIKTECESAFDEIFAAHRMFEGETMFRKHGGEIKIAINGHTFVSEGYDETSVVLSDESIFDLVTLSTKGGYSIESLYQFHDDIKEFVANNTIEL